MIGIFDSGFGGLMVMKHIVRALPQYDYVYLGDSARSPYGNRDQATIDAWTTEAVRWLFAQGCTLIIVACNTASSESLRRIQREWLPKNSTPPQNVLGVLIPVAEEAVRVSKNGRIGVVGTRATVRSGSYERELKKLRLDVTVVQQACPLLVPLIEEGWDKKPETKRILRFYMRAFKNERIDTLILGCTHYPVLMDQFQAKAGKRVRVLDPGPITAAALVDYLSRHPEIESRCTKGAARRFATTGDIDRFTTIGSRFFGAPIRTEKVSL